jgi:hypothetical protein
MARTAAILAFTGSPAVKETRKKIEEITITTGL